MRINKITSPHFAIPYLFSLVVIYLLVSHQYSDNYLSNLYSLPATREDPYAHTERLLKVTVDWLVDGERRGARDTASVERVEGGTDGLRRREICIVSPTKKRIGGIDHLLTSLGSISRGLNQTSRTNLAIIALFVDGERGWEEARGEGKFSSGLLDLATYMGDPRTGTRRSAWLQDEFDARDGRGKGLPYVIHFLYGLELCLSQTDAPWVLWLEDDVMARPDWYDIVKKDVIPSIGRREGKTGEKALFTMLFWNEDHMFWANEDIPVVMTYYIAPGLILFFAVCVTQIHNPVQGTQKHRYNRPTSTLCSPDRLSLNLTYGTLLSLLLAPYISLYLYTGKLITHSPMPPNGLSPKLSNACCSQALFFSREAVESVVEPLERVVKVGERGMLDRKGPDSLLFDLGSRPSRWWDSWTPWQVWSPGDTEFMQPRYDGHGKVDYRGKYGRGTTWVPGLFQHIGDVREYRNAAFKRRLKSWSFEVGMNAGTKANGG